MTLPKYFSGITDKKLLTSVEAKLAEVEKRIQQEPPMPRKSSVRCRIILPRPVVKDSDLRF